METCNIPEDQWTKFFDHLNHDQAGWSATIRVLHGQYGPQNIAMGLPCQGISLDTKGTRPSSVQVSAGNRAGNHVNDVVDLPFHIRQTEELDGSIDVQIEPANGPVTLIHLHDGPVH
ncbi:MAG TPA: DUF5335 family protein [Tepidisphaeraceae bacterium]|nr:DUF5335 family protein [Tepidisphaeraceae bacterium]